MTTMNFVLAGRDRLSRTFDQAGDAANRLHRRISAAATNSSTSINRMHRTVADRLAAVSTSTRESGEAFDALKGVALSLAPAIIPAAAAMAPLVASTGAAGVAVGVYAAALGPQIKAMGEATEAEKKYNDAVEKSGKRSKEAVAAEDEYRQAMAKLPPETRRAAAGVSILKTEYKEWSDSLAKDTLAPFNKGLALTTGLLPKLAPLVKGSSAELDRMVTILAGGMAAPGVDRLIGKFTQFATGALAKANDGLVHLMRNLDTGKVGGGVSEFMAFARENGPLVGEVLRSVGKALANLLVAGSDVGVGMLQAINAIAGLIAAVPPGAITVFLQLAVALKATQLAAAGMGAARAAVAAFGTQLVAMRTAAAATPGRLAAVGAAVNALSRTAKVAMIGTGIGLLLIGLAQLSTMGQKTAPDVDKLTTSLGNLARTGKITGEAARAFGTDLHGLEDSLRVLARPDIGQGIDRWISNLIKIDTPEIKAAKKDIDAVDKALAGLVKNGQADLASAALQRTGESFKHLTQSELDKELGDYRSALEDMKFEAELTADSMGMFGAQAQSVQVKLDAQKRSTDGLRQSIIALNEVNRAAVDARAGMEASIDAAAEGSKKYAHALDLTRGGLNLNSEAARAASAILNDLARKTEENVTSARDSGQSWEYAKGQYDRGRDALIRAADSMGLSRQEAIRYADQIMKTPNKTAYIRGNVQDLETKLTHAKNQLSRVPDSRKAEVRARIEQLEAALRKARGLLDGINGKTSTTYVKTEYSYYTKGPGPHKDGYVFKAQGGLVGGMAGGGPVRGPGTRTSDSILTALSNGEFVQQAKAVDKYGLPFMEAVNEGRLTLAKPAAPTRMAPTRQAPRAAGGATPVQIQITVNGALDPIASAKQIQKLLLGLKRNGGANVNLGV